MSNLHDVVVPDIGGAEGVEVIEVLVNAGDTVNAEDSLITLESEKATMEIPAPLAGKVAAIKVKVGDKVSEGDLIAQMEGESSSETSEKTAEPESEQETEAEPKAGTEKEPETKIEQVKSEKETIEAPSASAEIDIALPDLGTDDAVEIIELNVAVGDEIKAEDSLLTLESEKATMGIPAPSDGKIASLSVKIGDKVKTADIIGKMTTTQTVGTTEQKPASTPETKEVSAEKEPAKETSEKEVPKEVAKQEKNDPAPVEVNQSDAHAGPGVRRLANDLGVSLSAVTGSGRKGRILREDLTQFAKSQMGSGGGSSSDFNIAALPQVDFSKFGEVEISPLSRIQKLSGKYLHRNWVSVPHITQFDEADITEMEAFRKENKALVEKEGAKLTPLVFIMKAVVAALKAYPQFNSSLEPNGENLVMKKYFHIGVAVDTPNGLVVPVIRDVDKKGFINLAKELATLSVKARDGKLLPTDMKGGCFSISSLGGIGGTAFTPIVNMPEVAILGVSKSGIKPKFIDGEFKPRLILPLCLSYDHRVIDGALAARFIVHLSASLNDIRRLLL